MRDQEVIGLWEAYHQVYAPQEITEEVEIAAQYFYEMGLNEDGVDILIEDLGVEEFADWVYDIAEDYYLTERKLAPGETALPASSRRRIGGTRAASRRFSDPEKTSTAGGKRRVARKAARENEIPQETPRQTRIRELRAKAAHNATEKQPENSGSPKGIAGRIGAALGSAVKRAKSDIELTKKTAQTVGKAVGTGIEALNRASDTRLARQARVATKQGFKRQQKAMTAAGGALGKAAAKSSAIRDTFKAGQKLGKALRGEEVEAWIDSLIEEGYDLSEYTWEDMCEMYLDEGRNTSLQALAREKQGRQNPKGKFDRDKSLAMGHNKPSAYKYEKDPETGRWSIKGRRDGATESELRKKVSQRALRNRRGGVDAVPKKNGRPMFESAEDLFDFFYEDQMLNERKLTGSGLSSEDRRTWNRLVKQYGPEPFTNPRTPSGSNTRSASMVSSQTPQTPIRRRTTDLRNVQIKEDLFDYLLEYLVAEGYADTNQAALAIMANMSEEWKQDIIEDIDAILEAMRPGPRQRKLADKQYQTYGVTTRDRANAHNIAVRGDGPGTPGYEKKSTGGKGARYAGYGDQGAGNKARRRAGLEPLRGSRDPR